jgi:hypothetical protein
MNAGDRLASVLGNTMDYSISDRSFSPHYSDIGLGFDGTPGIRNLYFHYNRNTTTFAPFVEFPGNTKFDQTGAIDIVTQRLGGGQARIAFWDRNSFIVDCTEIPVIRFPFGENTNISEARVTDRSGTRIFEGYLPAGDKREPDELFPIIVGARIMAGTASGDGITKPLDITPDSEGRTLVAFSVNALEVDYDDILALLESAPDTIDEARRMTGEWLNRALNTLDFRSDDEREQDILAHAAYAMVSNLCRAPGQLAGRVSLFPSRGGYPILAPWDSCFHNLALEYMEPRVAEDSLLLLTDTMRADGKISCFVASTWARPHLSQPALIGWAARRLFEQRGDREFARNILPKMWRNCQWWLTQRMTRHGVIVCPHGVESGWDNSPRWDHGPILAVDMNSHLLIQMRVCVEFAEMLGETELHEKITRQTDELATAMMDVLYDPDANVFRDVVSATSEPVTVRTPAGFLPLLADVGLDETRARRMIEEQLLDPTRFFGEYPFPCVAYDEEVYDAPEYWRGPTWMPVGWLMLEILQKFGYDEQWHTGAERLMRMVIDDGDLREWFDSTTGAGQGTHDQGWTAAILLRLKAELD